MGLFTDPIHWADRPGNVADLIRDLADRGEIHTVDQAADIAERPWKWQMEWDRYERARDEIEPVAA